MQRFNLCIIVIELVTSACTKDAKSYSVDLNAQKHPLLRDITSSDESINRGTL